MKAQVICIDPPYDFSDQLNNTTNVNRGSKSNYLTMSMDDLCALPIDKIADPNGCVLALWVPGSMLADGIKLMNTYGFQQKQVFVWVKTKAEPFNELSKTVLSLMDSIPDYLNLKETIKNKIKEQKQKIDGVLGFFMGRLFRQTHEICLIGINTTKIYKSLMDRSQRSVCFAPNRGHSVKPEHLQNSLEKMFNGPKIEVFARRIRPNWVCIGNEVCNGEDIRVSLEKLID